MTNGALASRPVRFAMLLAQLVAILAVIHVYRVEAPAFKVLFAIVTIGFAVNYWLPAHARRAFMVVFSMAGAFAVLDWRVALLIHAVGLVMFGILRLPIAYRLRLGALLLLAAGLMVARPIDLGPYVPDAFWAVFGAIFMFRMMVYVYDLRHERGTPSLLDYLSYFYLLPNYYFLLFPVVDYKTFLHVRGRGDLDTVAQVGIRWILRGVVQLLLYRIVRDEVEADPQYVSTFPQLVMSMVLTYLLYLRVSGHFHIAIGMLRLFGYDLPETHRRWLLASGIADFWRRINIYWKDFIVKLVYMPTFFALRRRGETTALCIATGVSFFFTWALHSYQWYWLNGEWLLTVPDTLFWAILAVLVLISLLREQRATKRGGAKPETPGLLARCARVAGTFVLITILWSMWQCDTLERWIDLLTYWEWK